MNRAGRHGEYRDSGDITKMTPDNNRFGFDSIRS